MRTTLRFIALIVACMAVRGAEAQTAVPSDTMVKFTVVKGTTMYDLAEKMYGRGEVWPEMFRTNVEAGFLTPRDSFQRGDKIIVNLGVGREILLNRRAATSAAALVEEVIPAPVQAASSASDVPIDPAYLLNIGLILIGLVIAATLLAVFLAKTSNPITSGPPIRDGGITDEMAERHFQLMASSRTGDPESASYIPPERIRVVNIRRGRGYGLMRVRYRGDPVLQLKRLRGEVVYQATVEHPDRRQETLYCLQGCANDLVYTGTRYFADKLFRFEPENVNIPLSPPSTTVQAGNVALSINGEELTVNHNGQSLSFAIDDWAVRKGPDGGIIISEAGRHDVEFVNGRVRGGAKEESKAPEARAVEARTTSRL